MQTKNKVVLAKGVRMIGSVLHFATQTSADLILKAEVITLKKIDVYDLTENELKQARKERTAFTQYKIKQSVMHAIHSKSFKTKNVEPFKI